MTTAPTSGMSRADILSAAHDCVTRDRNQTYGPPEYLFTAIGMGWDALDHARGDRPRGAVDVALYMTVLKALRAAANPSHMDSWTDGCGYLACGGEIADADPVAHGHPARSEDAA